MHPFGVTVRNFGGAEGATELAFEKDDHFEGAPLEAHLADAVGYGDFEVLVKLLQNHLQTDVYQEDCRFMAELFRAYEP